MKLNLLKKLDVFFNDKSIRQHESNYKKIEETVNSNEKSFENHKKNEKDAHDSKQIKHVNTTVYNMLIYQMERIRNLVLGVDGDGIKEVTDSRVSNDGTTHGLLSERLFYDFNNFTKEIDRLEKKFVEINFDIYNPDKTGESPAGALLQNALDELKSSREGILYIKSGTYLIDRRLYIPENTKIIMDNDTILLRGHSGGFFDNGNPNNNVGGYEGDGNIAIFGGILDNNYENINVYPTKQVNMITLRHADNLVFKDITFRNSITAHVFDINGSNNITIDNCRFEGYIDLNNKGKYKGEAIQLSEYVPGGIEGGIFDGTPTQNVTVKNCIFTKSVVLNGFDTCIGNHISMHDVYTNNILIENNIFEYCTVGVRPYKWNDVTIINNVFENVENGIRASSVGGGYESATDVNGVPSNESQGGTGYDIRNNKFINYSSCGIAAYGQEYQNSRGYVKNLKITDNEFVRDNSQSGTAIEIELCSNVHIRSNIIERCYRGVRLLASHNIYIHFNHAEHLGTEFLYISPSQHGGYAEKTRHLHLVNNVVNTTDRNGVYLQNLQTFNVTNNTISNANAPNEKGYDRGGIYLNDCSDGRVESNDVWGDSKDFVILGSELKSVTAFNNGGKGTIKLFGTDATIGYYNVSSDDNIYRLETKIGG